MRKVSCDEIENKYEQNMQKFRSIESYEEKRAFLAKKIEELDKKKFPVEYKNSVPNNEAIRPAEQERLRLIVERAITEFLNEN